jgi:DNA polymerase-3 subunit beta
MKLRINKDVFLKGLHRAQGIVEKRQTMPILSNIRLSAEEEKIEISATDLEIGINETRKAVVIEKGSVTVNARKLYEIIKEMPDDKIELETNENNWLELKSGKAVFNIVGLSSEEFPNISNPSVEKLYEIEGDILKEMIDLTLFAVSQDEARYNLNGIFMEKRTDDNKRTLRMVATNGHRLAIVDRENNGNLDLTKGIIVPKKGISELKKILEDENELRVGILENSIVFKTEHTDLIIRLIDGEFPDYEQIVPKGNDRIMAVGRETLLSVIKRMSILSSERSKGIKFSLSPGVLEISVNNPDLGDAMEVLDVDYSGDNLSVIFNGRYLIEGLSAISDDDVIMEVKDVMSPGILRPKNGQAYKYIIMPMRF